MLLDVDRLQAALNEHEVGRARGSSLLGPVDLVAALVDGAIAIGL